MPSSVAPPRRTYDHYCPAAKALDVVGRRWMLLVVRELLYGSKRFTDLRAGLPGVGPNVLAERLAEMQDDGLIRRVAVPPPTPATIYELTELGEELRPVVLALEKFGLNILGAPSSSDHFRLSWLMRALEAMFRPEAARGVRETYEFRLDEEVFHVRVDDGRMEVREGHADDPAWIVETDVGTFIGLGARIIDGAEAVASGRAKVSGDLAAGMRSIELLGPHLGSLGGPGGMLGALQARVRPEAASGISESYEWRTEGMAFHMQVDDGEVTVLPGPAERPAMRFSADLGTLVEIYLGRTTPEEAVTQGRAQLEGDEAAAPRAWRILDIRHGAKQS
jgi:DNA-binding HxlR family transcriptional regulator/putative sterol carrier protein